MQIILSESGRRLKLWGVAALFCLASISQAQVSLSELAKAVAETGSNVSAHSGAGDSDVSSRAAAQSSLANGTLSAPGTAAVTAGGGKNGLQLEHVAVGPTTFNGDQKFVHTSPTEQSSSPSGAPFADTISSSGNTSTTMDAGEADRLATRRELAVAVAGAGGLFLIGVWIATHVTRSRRMALGHRD